MLSKWNCKCFVQYVLSNKLNLVNQSMDSLGGFSYLILCNTHSQKCQLPMCLAVFLWLWLSTIILSSDHAYEAFCRFSVIKNNLNQMFLFCGAFMWRYRGSQIFLCLVGCQETTLSIQDILKPLSLTLHYYQSQPRNVLSYLANTHYQNES